MRWIPLLFFGIREIILGFSFLESLLTKRNRVWKLKQFVLLKSVSGISVSVTTGNAPNMTITSCSVIPVASALSTKRLWSHIVCESVDIKSCVLSCSNVDDNPSMRSDLIAILESRLRNSLFPWQSLIYKKKKKRQEIIIERGFTRIWKELLVVCTLNSKQHWDRYHKHNTHHISHLCHLYNKVKLLFSLKGIQELTVCHIGCSIRSHNQPDRCWKCYFLCEFRFLVIHIASSHPHPLSPTPVSFLKHWQLLASVLTQVLINAPYQLLRALHGWVLHLDPSLTISLSPSLSSFPASLQCLSLH